MTCPACTQPLVMYEFESKRKQFERTFYLLTFVFFLHTLSIESIVPHTSELYCQFHQIIFASLSKVGKARSKVIQFVSRFDLVLVRSSYNEPFYKVGSVEADY